MAIRLYRCYDCTHHVKLGARKCGKCYAPTPIYNQLLWILISVFGLVILGALII